MSSTAVRTLAERLAEEGLEPVANAFEHFGLSISNSTQSKYLSSAGVRGTRLEAVKYRKWLTSKAAVGRFLDRISEVPNRDEAVMHRTPDDVRSAELHLESEGLGRNPQGDQG